ncbi:MAG: hypothetical protein KF699_06965 [Phycisphaeraceae bacterium]|nr:hypothetical protein [Phycisphaeraceae bacterium]
MKHGTNRILMAATAVLLSTGMALGADAAAWGSGVQQAHAALLARQPGAEVLTTAGRVTCVYGPAFSHGPTPQASAIRFLRDSAGLLGAEFADLIPGGLNADGAHLLPVYWDAKKNDFRFTLVSFLQTRDGLPVWKSDVRLLVRNDENSPLVLVTSGLKSLGNFRVAPGAQAAAIDQAAANESARGIFPKLDRFDAGRLVIFAGTPDLPAPPALAWELVAHGPAGADGVPQQWLFIVDALNGVVLHRESQIHHVDIVGTVSGMATNSYSADACSPEALAPMPYARVQVSGGNVAFADANGNFTIPHGGSSSVTVTSSPRGQWFRVFNQAQTTTTLSQSVTPPGPVNFVHNPLNDSEMVRAEVNAYVQSNIVRDMVLAYHPSYPGVANVTEFAVNVNIANTCNAFYNGTSINFYTAGGGCNNTAFGSVVHHEYGHHLVQSAGSGQGAYGEGFSDVTALLITDDSRLGIGFQTCANGIRNANNTCQYLASGCSTCGSAAHSCGMLLSGCVWSVRNNLLATNPADYREILSALAINSPLMHVGSTIAHDITITFLTLDDNDSNIMNGTPHYHQINNGFSDHSLPGPTLPSIGFEFPDGLPQVISPTAGATIRVRVMPISGAPQPGVASFAYNIGAGWVAGALTPVGENLYDAHVPASPCGTQVRYYFAARDTENLLVYHPSGAPSSWMTSISASGQETVFTDDFEIHRGWTVGAPTDTATLGIWVRVDPNGTAAQPEDDHTPDPGTQCFVTGNAPPGAALGAEDVDNGATTLTSPTLDLSGVVAPKIGYWRWYSNNTGAAPGADVFVVDISNDGGATWVNVETVGPTGPETVGGWRYYEFNVEDRIAPTSNMKLRFVASDFGAGSLVEAALDDFFVTAFTCPSACPADFDGNGTVEVADIFQFLSAWFASDPAADIDGTPGLQVSDIFVFLSHYFTPCP